MMSFADTLRPSHATASESSINPANSPEQKKEAEREVRTRIPMSVPRAKLTTPEIPGYHSHWINDVPGRILQAMQAGYTFVSKEEALINMPDLAGDVVGEGTDLGSRVSVVVGRDESERPLRAYLMKLPDALYCEDQAAHDARVDSIHDAMMTGAQKVDGESHIDRAKRYVRKAARTNSFTR